MTPIQTSTGSHRTVNEVAFGTHDETRTKPVLATEIQPRRCCGRRAPVPGRSDVGLLSASDRPKPARRPAWLRPVSGATPRFAASELTRGRAPRTLRGALASARASEEGAGNVKCRVNSPPKGARVVGIFRLNQLKFNFAWVNEGAAPAHHCGSSRYQDRARRSRVLADAA